MSLSPSRYVLVVLFYQYAFSIAPVQSSIVSYQNDQYCLLCEDGVAGLKRPNFFIDEHGTTCALKAVNMAANLPKGGPLCASEIDNWREYCCGDEEPDEIEQQPTQPPGWDGPMGEYAPCEICSDGTYPDNPGMVINMLYLGPGSCRQYYHWGRAGFVQDHLCDPLQFFAYEPCGCGINFIAPDPSDDDEDDEDDDDDGKPFWCIGFLNWIPFIC